MSDELDLDPDEREMIRKRREERSRDNFTVRIRQGDNEADLPYGKARGWFQKTFGIDLDEEPAQDEDEPETKPKGKTSGAEVRRFSGRRISLCPTIRLVPRVCGVTRPGMTSWPM